MHYAINDAGAKIQPQFGGLIHAVAAGAGDNTAITGVGIDITDNGSLTVIGLYSATLNTGETLTIAMEYQESSDNSSFDTAVALQAATIMATGVSGSQEFEDQIQFDLRTDDKKQYFRANGTANLSASGTDTSVFGIAYLLLGEKTYPNTLSTIAHTT